MDNRYQDYLSYLEFLHRIGRRVGYKSEAQSESMKMTREEQIKMTGLVMKDSDTIGITFSFEDIMEMMIDNNETNQLSLIKKLQEKYIDFFYEEIEKLLKKIPEPTNE